MSEIVIRAVSAILTTIGLMAINSGHINIGYPLFGTGLFWLTYRGGVKISIEAEDGDT